MRGATERRRRLWLPCWLSPVLLLTALWLLSSTKYIVTRRHLEANLTVHLDGGRVPILSPGRLFGRYVPRAGSKRRNAGTAVFGALWL